jgi:hypothetical protein
MVEMPSVFISCTSDLRSARKRVADALYQMGYEPVWQEIEPTDGGELLEVLRKRIEPCALMIQFVGSRYGAEPALTRPQIEFGRVSYTQFEAMHFEKLGREVIYLFLDPTFPTDAAPPEPAELTALQAAYIEQIKEKEKIRYGQIATPEALVHCIRRIREDLASLRRRDGQHASEPAAPTSRKDAEPDPPAAKPRASKPTDENVQFTVYRPKSVPPRQWQTMLAFAHLSERRPDEENAPDPIEEMRRQAQAVLGKQASAYASLTQDSSAGVPRGGVLTFVPDVPQVEFNPPNRSFNWHEAVHREEFRFLADAPDGVLRGKMSVFLGALLLAEVPLVIKVSSTSEPAASRPTEPHHARAFKRIFASYSHKDLAIVEQFEEYLATLDVEMLRDWKHLRSGEHWDQRLLQLIEEADVFQLFWSNNSMQSPYCRREWEHAMSLGRERFVRPVYWESPMPKADGLPPEKLRALHFQRLNFTGPKSSTQNPSIPQSRSVQVPFVGGMSGGGNCIQAIVYRLTASEIDSAESMDKWLEQADEARREEERLADAAAKSAAVPRDVEGSTAQSPATEIPNDGKSWGADNYSIDLPIQHATGGGDQNPPSGEVAGFLPDLCISEVLSSSGSSVNVGYAITNTGSAVAISSIPFGPPSPGDSPGDGGSTGGGAGGSTGGGSAAVLPPDYGFNVRAKLPDSTPGGIIGGMFVYASDAPSSTGDEIDTDLPSNQPTPAENTPSNPSAPVPPEPLLPSRPAEVPATETTREEVLLTPRSIFHTYVQVPLDDVIMDGEIARKPSPQEPSAPAPATAEPVPSTAAQSPLNSLPGLRRWLPLFYVIVILAYLLYRWLR